MKSDKELRKCFEVTMDNNGILCLTFLDEEKDPDGSVRVAELIKNDALAIIDQDAKKQYKVIVDLAPMGTGGFTNSRARNKYIEISEHKQITKIGILGGNILIRTTVGLIFKAAGKGNAMKWFTNKTKAVKWLGEN